MATKLVLCNIVYMKSIEILYIIHNKYYLKRMTTSVQTRLARNAFTGGDCLVGTNALSYEMQRILEFLPQYSHYHFALGVPGCVNRNKSQANVFLDFVCTEY